MSNDRSADLVEDIIEAIAHGEVADSVSAFTIRRRSESTVELGLGDPRFSYLISVSRKESEPQGEQDGDVVEFRFNN